MVSTPSTRTQSPLLQTKISIPQIPPEYISRSRLTEWIDRAVKGPLTLLTTAPGYGKTHLLVEWARKTDLPVAWYTIDHEDNEVSLYHRYLIAALQRLEPQIGQEALEFIQSSHGAGLKTGMTLLINDITQYQKDLVLVLDDFHMLDNAAILENASYFIKHLPPNLHLIIASRAEPQLDLTNLRAKGRIVELDSQNLRFTNEEIALYIKKASGVDLPPETIRLLEEYTDGWITALQLSAISIRHHTDPIHLFENFQGGAHILVDFLAEEVLDQQPEEIRQFLLRSSVLETFNGPLCEAVVRPDAQPGYGTVMLNRLEHSHLFITAFDEKHEWFRYHHLFADFLRHVHAEINPAEIPLLNKRAALWFEKQSDLNEAFHYAFQSGDLDWTADLIERNIKTMVQSGEIFPLSHWIGMLPEELIHQRPRLGLAYAWGAIAAYQLDLASYWINSAKQSLELMATQAIRQPVYPHLETEEPLDRSDLWNIHGALAISQSMLSLLSGDADKAAEFSEQAADYLSEENPFIHSLLSLDDSLYFSLSGDTQKAIETLNETIRMSRQANNLMVTIIATFELAEMQALQGHLSLAWATLEKGKQMVVGPDGEPLPLVGLLDIGLGEILLERNLLKEAQEYLERGCQVAQSLWSISSLDGMISLAHLHQAQGDFAGAQAIIDSTSQAALSTESSQWDDILVAGVAVRLALLRDDLVAAEQWWRKGGFHDVNQPISLVNYPYHIFEFLQLIQARFLLARGLDSGNKDDLLMAEEILENLLVEAERFQRLTSQIEILVLQAIIHYALDRPTAIPIIIQALSLGEPEGYCRIYLDEGKRLTPLLRLALDHAPETGRYLPSPTYIESLLNELPPASGLVRAEKRMSELPVTPLVLETEDSFTITLSPRELEVLRLIAEGKSNQEISAELYLALNTVKRHASNIYAKLDVSKRTQAIAKARHLGLVP